MIKRAFCAALFCVTFFAASPALANDYAIPCIPPDPTSNACNPVTATNPLPVATSAAPTGSTPLSGNATGTTSAVVGTLGAAAGKTTYICGFNVVAIGGTATVGPVIVAGLVGSSQRYAMNAAATPVMLSQSFTPCIPASAANTAITVTTTADGTATEVDVNSWGYRQ